MNRLLRNVLVVLGLTIALTSTALGLFLANEEPVKPVEQPKAITVMIAARQIQAGHRIEKADLGWQQVAPGSVPSGAFAKPSQSEINAVGSIALRNLAAGELIAQQYLAPAPAEDTLAGNLNPGWRAVTLTADASQTAAGMLLPNDKVDLILAANSLAPAPLVPGQPSDTSTQASASLISNIRVIAINGAMRPKTESGLTDAKAGGTVTLEVRPQDVAAILSAASAGRLGIALRSRFDGTAPTAPAGAKRALASAQKDKAALSPAAQKAAKPPRSDETRSAPPGVIIVRSLEKTRAN